MLISNTVSIGKLVCSERKRLKATQRNLALSSGTGLRFIVDVEKGKPTCKSGKVLEVSNCPYVAEAFPGKWIDRRIEIPVHSIERTFWRKPPYCMQKHTGRWKKMMPERYSLHYDKFAILAQAESAHSAPKFCPVITPKCGICFSVNCHLGMKFLMASKFLKC
jgi:hypothetical protein